MKDYVVIGSRYQKFLCCWASWHSPCCTFAYPHGWCVFFDMESLVRFTSRWWHPQILYKHKLFARSSLYVAFLMIVTILRMTIANSSSVIYLRSFNSFLYPLVVTGTNALNWMYLLNLNCSATKTHQRNLRSEETPSLLARGVRGTKITSRAHVERTCVLRAWVVAYYWVSRSRKANPDPPPLHRILGTLPGPLALSLPPRFTTQDSRTGTVFSPPFPSLSPSPSPLFLSLSLSLFLSLLSPSVSPSLSLFLSLSLSIFSFFLRSKASLCLYSLHRDYYTSRRFASLR